MTEGFGTFSRSSWTGSRNTAPETPTGVVTSAITKPQRSAISGSGTGSNLVPVPEVLARFARP